MPIVSHVRFLADFPVETPERIPAKWADMLKANAERINKGRQTKIPDELAFQNRVSGPAHLGYSPSLSSSFVSRSGLDAANIRANHANKLKRSFRSYRDGLDRVFADGAKLFKELVDTRSAKYGRGMAETLGLTGTSLEGLGPSALAVYWLTDDKRVAGFLRSSDVILQGGPFLITTVFKRSAFKAALTERLTQAGIIIARRGLAPAVLSEQNNQINSIVQSLIEPAFGLDPFATGGLSHVDFQEEDGKLYLDVQVSLI